MPTCPNCGSYVPLGNHSCSCGTSMGSRHSRYDEKENKSSSGTKGFFDNFTTYELNAQMYETNISLARKLAPDNNAIEHYKNAVNFGFDYWDEIENKNYIRPTIPKKTELLSTEDLENCSELYYNNLGSLLYFDELNDLEELLTKTGNKQVYEKAYKKWNNDRKEAIEELKQKKANAEKKVKSFFSEMGETYTSGAKKIFDELQNPHKSNKQNKSKKSKKVRIKID